MCYYQYGFQVQTFFLCKKNSFPFHNINATLICFSEINLICISLVDLV